MVRNLSARTLFIAGIIVLPAYLLQDSLVVRSVQVVWFGWLATVAGKRLYWFYFFSITVGITFFHLLVPTGAVLFEVFGLKITLGAFTNGVFKSLTIVGMVFISLVAVRADLRIPGRFGSTAGKVFWSFEQIMSRRDRVTVRHPFRDVDTLLLNLYERLARIDEAVGNTQAMKATADRSSMFGALLCYGTAVAQWFLLFAPLP